MPFTAIRPLDVYFNTQMKNQNYNRIDFMSDWQNKVSVGLGDVFLTERESNGQILNEIWMSTNQFKYIVDFYDITFKTLLHSEDLIFKYHNREYVGGDEEWAEDVEVRIERVEEFLDQLERIDEHYDPLKIVSKEYKALKDFIGELMERGNQLYFKAESY